MANAVDACCLFANCAVWAGGAACLSTYVHLHAHATADSYQYPCAYLDAVTYPHADRNPCSYRYPCTHTHFYVPCAPTLWGCR
jgi:hypothetical protein